MFYRNDERDDFWHMGAGTLIKSGKPDEGVLISPGTMHCGEEGVPFCSEAWDAISRYIYTGLQGGSIMHGWMNDSVTEIGSGAFSGCKVVLEDVYRAHGIRGGILITA